MEKDVVKELNWKEKLIYKLFSKTFKKVCSIYRIKFVNILLYNKDGMQKSMQWEKYR